MDEIRLYFISKQPRVKTRDILEFKQGLSAVFFALHLNVFPYRFFRYANSALMLAAARLRYIAGTKWGSRWYLNMKRLQELETERTVLSDKKSTCPSGQVVA